MSGYKNFIVAGAGNLGVYIIEELAKLKNAGVISTLGALTRSSQQDSKLASLGATPHTVSYTSPTSLSNALKDVDIVISTLGGDALAAQESLAVAARQSGVKLFVPSEFGIPTVGRTDGLFGEKERLRLKMIEMGLPYASFFTGPFSDFIFIPWLGFDFANGKATIGGSGDGPVSFTSRTDIARYVSHVLTALPKSKLENRVFRIEGERTTFNKILEAYQARTGKKLDITRRPRAELVEMMKNDPNDFATLLYYEWDVDGTVGKEEEVAEAVGEWKEWEPKKVLDVLLG